jgi:methionine sulfoxide reductase heme-binding subunit
VKRAAAIVCYGASAIAISVVVAVGLSIAFVIERDLYWIRGLGWSALIALLLALCASPIARVVPRIAGAIAIFRRALGISAAALACVHGSFALTLYFDSVGAAWEMPWARSGLIAALILIALWVTSFPIAVRVMRIKHWKELHRLAYGAAILAAHHVLLAPFTDRAIALGAFGVALAIGLLRLVPQRR